MRECSGASVMESVSLSRVLIAEAQGQFENPEKGQVLRWKPLPEE
jgi:hypothetical protein